MGSFAQLMQDIRYHCDADIFKVIFCINFINCFIVNFSTVFNRTKINSMVEEIFNAFPQSQTPVMKKVERSTFTVVILLLFSFICYILTDVVDARKFTLPFLPTQWNVSLIQHVYYIWVKISVTVFVITVYINCSLHFICFAALTVDTSHSVRHIKSLLPSGGHVAMVQLIQMEEKLKQFETKFSLVIFQMIISHFIETTLFIYRLSSRGNATVVMMNTVFWTFMNATTVIYFISDISLMQDKLKQQSLTSCDSIVLENLSHPTLHQLMLLAKMKSLASQRVTVWKIVKVNRSLIIGICSSFLSVAVLLVQINNGSLRASESPSAQQRVTC